jgi:hypothetical protein
MSVKISQQGSDILVSSPYDPSFPERAKALGGKWYPITKVWSFDARDREAVEAACLEAFGECGTPSAADTSDLVTVRIALDDLPQCAGALTLAGRTVAQRPRRDSRVTLGAKVVIVSGGFPASGGSVKTPRLDPLSGTVLEVRDLPRAAWATLTEQAGVSLCTPLRGSGKRLAAD